MNIPPVGSSSSTPTLVERMSAFAAVIATYNRGSLEAFSAVAGSPADAIAKIDLLFAKVPDLEETEVFLIHERAPGP